MATETKRAKVVEDREVSLDRFLAWCDQSGLKLSEKVCVCHKGTVAEYGMLAKEDIEEGEVLFTVPREAILHRGSSKVSGVLDKEKNSLESASSWVPLLLALLHECTSSQSYWSPYLSLWNDFRKLDHPMFWSKEERDTLLKGTGIPEAVNMDLDKIHKEYSNVVLPLITKYSQYWAPDVHTVDRYTNLVAFVMAYSFQEPNEEDDDEDDEEDKTPNPPMMVPMADMLNHVAKHNANLEFTPGSLKMVCVRPICKGEEVFNTYGQMANWQLLHMYGFTEPFPSNSNDTVDITVRNFYTAAKDIKFDFEPSLLDEKWRMLNQMERNDVIIFGNQGCLTDATLNTILKVFCMSQEEFLDFKENEGWEDDDDDEDEISLAFSNEGLQKLKTVWKKLIHGATRLTLCCFTESNGVVGRKEDPDKMLMEDKEAFAKLSSRRQRALHVRYGQKSILYNLLELTK
ncbi:N-lysine methyltransferase setd6-like [Eucyclogobius newberryi]|uniref:N-lysine methyltransferase setd6-like n=1 Tax=Eucyclogobius newberryi TaxID=166745 RepID=UPI003B5B1F37